MAVKGDAGMETDMKKLSLEIFESATDYLPRLLEGLHEASGHFTNNEYLEGYRILYDANEGLMWFNEVVQGLPVLMPQGENTFDVEKKWRPYINALNNILSFIEKGEGEFIGRVLEDEIIPFIKFIYDVISGLKQSSDFSQ